ncbi:Testicular acid phosphatase-like protein [Armadillidium vulgare]|nr:Testicular acid phosphatase-like protein [Armadillidium vulgare]
MNILYLQFFRHAEIAPSTVYSNDSWINRIEDIWPYGFSQITKRGKNNGYELGLWLRKRYDGFIKKKFDPEEFYIRSTDIDVNLMTALLVTDAFYYPDNGTRFTDFPRIPTPVHTAPLDVDKRSYNLTLPSWAVQNYDEIRTASQFRLQYFSYTSELKRLRVGPVFRLQTENMRKKSIGELPEQKMFMYSYNGLYLAIMLNTMGFFIGTEPPYSSPLIFELHQTGKNYFVKILFQNDTTFQNPPLELTLPDCSLECPLSDFINLLKDFIPKDWEKECHSIDPISEPSYPSNFTGLSWIYSYA